MNYIINALLALALFIGFQMAHAGPRIETRDNFCHFVDDPDDSDAEHFISNCPSRITTDNNGIANGVAYVRRKEPAWTAIQSNTWTYADTGVPCVMVDSNGTEYHSRSFRSTVKVGAIRGSLKWVTYSLNCPVAVEQ